MVGSCRLLRPDPPAPTASVVAERHAIGKPTAPALGGLPHTDMSGPENGSSAQTPSVCVIPGFHPPPGVWRAFRLWRSEAVSSVGLGVATGFIAPFSTMGVRF